MGMSYISIIYAVIQIHSSPILSRRPLVTQKQPDVGMFFNFIIMSPHLTLTVAIMIRDSINQGCHPYRITWLNATIVYFPKLFLLFMWNFVFVPRPTNYYKEFKLIRYKLAPGAYQPEYLVLQIILEIDVFSLVPTYYVLRLPAISYSCIPYYTCTKLTKWNFILNCIFLKAFCFIFLHLNLFLSNIFQNCVPQCTS